MENNTELLELENSELGTLEYWENTYKKEIKNFSQHGDCGEIWFGEDIVCRIIEWISSKVDDKTAKIVDIGCGNGHILIELAQLGFSQLTGLDYSEEAVNLAKAVTEKEQLSSSSSIKYQICDAVEDIKGTFHLIHDKGTYDAISLSANAKESCQNYIRNVAKALQENGYFIVTSCNWTEQELELRLQDLFKLHETVPTPTFKFGGKIGSVVSICVFTKKVNNSSD